MKTYIADIVPKIKRFSQKLDNQTLLVNQHWVGHPQKVKKKPKVLKNLVNNVSNLGLKNILVQGKRRTLR